MSASQPSGHKIGQQVKGTEEPAEVQPVQQQLRAAICPISKCRRLKCAERLVAEKLFQRAEGAI